MKIPARKSLFFLFVFLLILVPLIFAPEPASAGTYDCSSQSEIPQAQCEALVSFYNSTGGDSWTNNTNWLSGTAICDVWYGVTCYAGNVNGLSLEYNNLDGTLPSDFGDLANLKGLYLSGNSLSGSLPASFYTMSSLWNVELSNNQFSGTLSESIADLDDLVYFSIDNNQFTGSLPAGVGDMGSIQLLKLNDNSFDGTVPSTIGNATTLWEVYLYNNSFTGSLPSEIGSLVDMNVFEIQNNNFSGSIPSTISGMSTAWSINLSHNAFTGNIPSTISGLTGATTLRLSFNQLDGSIPDGMGVMTALGTLDLNNNNLTGSIPSDFADLGLNGLNLSYNQLTGTIPILDGTALSYLDLENNSFSGALGSWMLDSAISYLYFGNTNMCKPIESEYQTWLDGLNGYTESGIDCPGTAVLQSPLYGVGSFDTTPTMTWAEAANAEEYRLYINWSGGVVHNSWYTGTEICSGGTCSVTLVDELEAGNYQWFVQTRNTATSGPWSDPGNFSVIGFDPLEPSGTISDVTPEYGWYENPDADEYRLFVSHAAVGTVVNEYWYQSELICDLGQCSVTSNVHLRTGNHSWAIQGRNDSRTVDEWTDWQTFKLLNSTPPDEAIVPVSPTGGETTDVNPTYTWNAVERASWYKIFVGSQTTGKVYNAYHRAAEVCYGDTCDVTPTDYLLSGSPVSSLEYATEFNWYVMPINVAGNGSFSSAQNFVTRP